MQLIRIFIFLLAVANLFVAFYWWIYLGLAAGIAYKMPEQLALGIYYAQGWDVEKLRPALHPPEAAEGPYQFARAAAEPAQSILRRVSDQMVVLMTANAALLVAAGDMLGRCRTPRPAPADASPAPASTQGAAGA